MILSKTYEAAFHAMLADITGWHNPRYVQLSACWPECGRGFSKGSGVLVIGRALNGWPIEFDLLDTGTVAGRAGIAERARKHAEDGALGWLQTRDIPRAGPIWKRSGFWRVTEKVVTALGDEGPNPESFWADRIAWSNLAKVTWSQKGNPEPSLLQMQLNACARLLRLEVEELNPQVVLLYAGLDWCEWFRDALPWGRLSSARSGPVLHVQRAGGQFWVACDRPDTRKKGSSEKAFAEMVLSAVIDQR